MLQVFRHADAELRADVLAVERDLVRSRRARTWRWRRVARAGFEDDAFGAELPRLGFQGIDDLSPDAAAADGGIDVHAFDFGEAGFVQADGAAADGLVVEIGNEKRAATFGDFFRVEAKEVRAVFGIDGFEFGVEGLN